ncbi:MAG: HAD-IIB family hydrolase [Halobacteriota archaeon]
MKLLATDVDNTLTGDRAAYEQLNLFLAGRHDLVIAYVTGRDKVQLFEIMDAECLRRPGYMICNVGTEIYNGPDYQRDEGWTHYINWRWDLFAVQEALKTLPYLFQQSHQFEFKQSYHLLHNAEGVISEIHRRLDEIGVAHKVIYSSGTDLDIIPARAGKGEAVDYIRKRLKISRQHVLVAGDSGNDLGLLSSRFLAVVVGNHKAELTPDALPKDVYWAQKPYAAGVLEGIEHFMFLTPSRSKQRVRSGDA